MDINIYFRDTNKTVDERKGRLKINVLNSSLNSFSTKHLFKMIKTAQLEVLYPVCPFTN